MSSLTYGGSGDGPDRIEDEKDLQIDVVVANKGDAEDVMSSLNGVQALTDQADEVDPNLRAASHQYYSLKAEQDGIAPRGDFDLLVDDMMGLSQEKALDIIHQAIETHRDDPNLQASTMARMMELVQGYKANDMTEADWLFRVKAEAAVLHYHSPYPEVRAVTSPGDDPDLPAETLRAYLLGFIFMGGSTAINSFFNPRQPSINLGANVLQVLVVPCGMLLAKVLPDWGLNVRGKRWTLNPGPWSFKEQVFCIIFFDVSSGFGGAYNVFFVQKLPQYLQQDWVNFGYEFLLALSVQSLGFGTAGLMRRFVIYPVTALFPTVLPSLALSRALVSKETRKGESINGWRLSRYHFFALATIVMFIWFFIPNFLFQALHSFNWMTWFAPENFTLAMVTGFYGGLGYNPLATFDYNVAGTGKLTTPFFSTLQSTIGMIVSGLILIAMYWSNMYWTAYMPINSNQVFNNQGTVYNATHILDNGQLSIEKYKQYGPPMYAAYGIFEQGQRYAWFGLCTYIFIRYWPVMSRGFNGFIRSLFHPNAISEGHDDSFTRLNRKYYREVPEWWYLCALLGTFVCGVAAVEAWPTATPWWSLLIVIGTTAFVMLPFTFMLAQANIAIDTTCIYHVLSSIIFPSNAQAFLIFSAFGTQYILGAQTFIVDVKLGHYARIPPRAVFRAQMISMVVHSLIFIVILNWLISSYDPGSLCSWDDPDHFVCSGPTQLYSNAIQLGVFGSRNTFELYPILPWCFLLGAGIGALLALGYRYGDRVREACRRRTDEVGFARWDKWFFRPISWVSYVNPTIFWSGAGNWGGGTNLSYYINGLYISFGFMFFLKRRYPAWWEKYNYLLEMGFQTGIAFSGLVQNLAFKFGSKKITAPVWWGNTVSTAGVDYKAYNQKAALLKVPKGGFGLKPSQYPMNF